MLHRSGERAPGRRLGMSPNRGGRSADKRWCGTPHPVARLTAKPVPSAEGNSRPMTRAGAPIGASPRRFSFVLGTAFWKRTGAPIRNALDSTGFHPLSSAPPARCRTDPRSWAGRCLPRPPEARLTRPNPQAPHPPRSHASHENALGRVGRMSEHQAMEQIKNKKINPVNRARAWQNAEMTPQTLRRRFSALRAPRNDDGSVMTSPLALAAASPSGRGGAGTAERNRYKMRPVSAAYEMPRRHCFRKSPP